MFPVYDRSSTPPLFVGVIGMDFPLSAAYKAFGYIVGIPVVLDQIVLVSTAKYPTLNRSEERRVGKEC